MPNLTSVVKSNTLYGIYINDAERIYDGLISNVEKEITRMQVLGIDKKQIAESLLTDLENEGGLFSTFKGQLSKATQDLVNTTSQLESNTAIQGAKSYLWELDPTVEQHCDSCLEYSGMKPQSWDEWESIGIPGAGNTECGVYCRCTLTPIGL